MEIVVCLAVAVVRSEPRADLETVVVRDGHIPEIEEAMNIRAEQEPVSGPVLAAGSPWLDMGCV
jgi:hypothetical protein